MARLTDRALVAAEAAGAARVASNPRAKSAHYDAGGRLVIELVNGCAYVFPVALVQDLQGATPAQLACVEVDGLGFNLSWPALGVDLYVPVLVSGIFGTQAWMARALAGVAGRARSPAKAAAARENGAKGGRPRKVGG